MIALSAVGAYRGAVAWWDYPEGIAAMPPAATILTDRHGEPLAAFVAGDGRWHWPLERDDVSDHLLRATVAVEDARFFEHGGVDWRAVGAAVRDNLLAADIRRGASTITMQVHRLRCPPRRRSVAWKIEQAIRAEQIERAMPKDAILLEWINRAPFGGNLVGAGAASWRYFGKRCRDLSLGEAALLAGLPQNPERLRPDRHPDRARARRDHVLARMLACGFVDASQYEQAIREPIEARWRDLPQTHWATEGLLPALARSMQHAAGGESLATGNRQLATPPQLIPTTLDASTQRQVAAELRAALASLRPSGVNAAAAVVLAAASGECLATASFCDEAPAIDLARRPRSTGSILKPFIYASAFEAGICSPGTLIDDSPRGWAGYVPRNYDSAFAGRMSAAAALASSRNIPALTLLAKVGVEDAVDAMSRAGLRTIGRRPARYGLSLAIGGGEATVMEVAEAYAALARSARRAGSSGVEGDHVYAPRACAQVLAALSDPARARAAGVPEAAERGVAWKTGTSSGHRDAWCAAVTGRRVVVVWFGRVRGEGSGALVGAEAAAPVALRLAAALDPQPTAWPAPPGPEKRELETRPRLAILSPPPGAQIVLNDELPLEHQRIALRAAASESARLWWLVDGEPLAETRAGETAWWRPRPGEHDVRVIDDSGRAARVEVRVGG